MRSREPYRVAVVGGGVAGLAAACALPHDGYAVGLSNGYLTWAVLYLIFIPASTKSLQPSAHCSWLLHERAGPASPCGCRRRDALVGWHHVSGARWPAKQNRSRHCSRRRSTARRLFSGPRPWAGGGRDKLAIARAIAVFLRGSHPEDDRQNFAEWLQRTGQTRNVL